MENLPAEMLTMICNRLQWRDRQIIRRISTKFARLPLDPVTFEVLRLEQKETSFCFGLTIPGEKETVLEITEEPWRDGYEITIAEAYTGVDYGTYERTLIRCNSNWHHGFVEFYMAHFLSRRFIIKKLEVVNLPSHHLIRICWRYPSSKNFKLLAELEFYTKNTQFSQEELHLLAVYKDLKSFKFCPPTNFTIPDNFWSLPLISTANNLELSFGEICGGYKKYSQTVDNDLGIDNDFLGKLVAAKKARFSSNTSCWVTMEFIKSYIEGCLNGGHIMPSLHLRLNLSTLEKQEMSRFLLGQGFHKLNIILFGIYSIELNQASVAGSDKLRLDFYILRNSILITTDWVNPEKKMMATIPRIYHRTSWERNGSGIKFVIFACLLVSLVFIYFVHSSIPPVTTEDHIRKLILLVDSTR